jgi:hypothetical protein
MSSWRLGLVGLWTLAACSNDSGFLSGSDLAASGTGDFSSSSGDLGGGGAPDLACPMSCNSFYLCCNGECIDPFNDPRNCNGCNKQCAGPHPFCGNAVCSQPPCVTNIDCMSGFCCGARCCTYGQLCCDINGAGPTKLECFTPTAVAPTCPGGCVGCQ